MVFTTVSFVALFTLCMILDTSVWTFPVYRPFLLRSTCSLAGKIGGLCYTRRRDLLRALSSSKTGLSSGDNERCKSPIMKVERRDFVVGAVSSFAVMNGMMGSVSPAMAEDGLSLSATSKSTSTTAARGPIELLRPATRVRLYIDSAIDMCRTIKESLLLETLTKAEIKTKLQPLSEFLLPERSFILPDESKLAKMYLEIDTTTPWQAARLQERVQRGKERGIDYTAPYDKVNTAIQQWGDRRQFELLQKRQRSLEKNNEIRAAFNAYTNNIIFSDSYRLNVDGENKKALVRNDALPDVNAVVVSDLDLRDLYRNQVLQNIDDAKSELIYQLKQASDDEIDIDEVLNYLFAAQVACNDWFSFVPSDDVDAARRFILKGQ